MDAISSPTLHGRVVRTLERTPRLSYERFWLDTDRASAGQVDQPWGEAAEVIDERTVEGPSAGPILLWDEVVGERADLSRLRETQFGNNLAVWVPAPPVIRLDASGHAPLPDHEFWPYIDMLQGRLWEKTIDAAAAALSTRDEEFILRWEETCARKANALADSLEPIEQYGSDAFLGIGAVLGKGQACYQAALRDWSAWDPAWITDRAQSIRHLGALALDHKLKRTVLVTTSFTSTAERIKAAQSAQTAAHKAQFEAREGWGRAEVEAVLGVEADNEAVADFLAEHGHELGPEGLAAARDAPLPAHLRGLPKSLSMKAARALVEDGAAIRMRVVFADVTVAHESDMIPRIQAALESFGGSVCSEVEADRMQYGGPLDSDVLTIKRRFRGTREDYVKRFVSP